ncbi:MAG: hypothetical protein AB1Z65_14420 [Candidatus Sulfomarinibacteraceae bacterium]
MRSTFRAAALITLVLGVIATGGAVWAAPPMGPVTVTASDLGDQFTPAVAWDHEHEYWLAVWEEDVSGVRQIVGSLVGVSGGSVTNSFLISSATLDQTDPDVVYDPGHDRYLVVWVNQFSATDSDINGRFIPWNGLDPAQLPFGIEYPDSIQVAPALEYAPFPIDEYFVVWENVVNLDPATIKAKRLYPDSGSEIGPSFEVVGDATYQRRKPAVAWNADAGRYLVTYERSQGTAQEDVYAASLSYSGTVFSPDLGIAGYPGEENQIDVAACGGSWMVVWKGGAEPSGSIFARPVAGDLALGSIHNVGLFSQERWPKVECVPHGVGFFLVWEITYSNPTGPIGISGAMVGAGGTVTDTFAIVGTGVHTLDYTRPAVSVGDSRNRAFVIWETDRDGNPVFQDLAGRWVEMALFADDFETGNTSRWSATIP